MTAWADGYTYVDRTTTVSTLATGSGAGVAAVLARKVEIGTSDAYLRDGLGYAALENRTGKFILPTPEGVGAALAPSLAACRPTSARSLSISRE